MTVKRINVRYKKEIDELTYKYRNDGYMLTTYGTDYRELENGVEFVIIERIKRTRK